MADRSNTTHQSWVHARGARTTLSLADLTSDAKLAAFFAKGEDAQLYTVPAYRPGGEAVCA